MTLSVPISLLRGLYLEAGNWHLLVSDPSVMGVAKYRLPAETLASAVGITKGSPADALEIWKNLENRCGDPIAVEFVGVVGGPSQFQAPAGSVRPGLDLQQ